MKLITHFELARKSKAELHDLFRTVAGAAVAYPHDSVERNNALGSGPIDIRSAA